jgi:hypothetical protein
MEIRPRRAWLDLAIFLVKGGVYQRAQWRARRRIKWVAYAGLVAYAGTAYAEFTKIACRLSQERARVSVRQAILLTAELRTNARPHRGACQLP